VEAPSRAAIYYKQPFGDHLLDYEFLDPRAPHDHAGLTGEESTFLSKFLREELIKSPRRNTRMGKDRR
jgi:hypothetical protein